MFKILTNVRLYKENVPMHKVGGIAPILLAFVRHIEARRKSAYVIQANVLHAPPGVQAVRLPAEIRGRHFAVLSRRVSCPPLNEILSRAKTVADLRRELSPIIESYAALIAAEKPDLVLVNGTYYLSWCLYQAAALLDCEVVLHYHGILSKETAHWRPSLRLLMNELERTFDGSRTRYVFPSTLARIAVEQSVFGHGLPESRVLILPNPIPNHFFEVAARPPQTHPIGFVMRWSAVKNLSFVRAFARYNAKRAKAFDLRLVSDLSKGKLDYARLKDLLKITRPVMNEKLAPIYAGMGVVLSPSRFETYGNVAQEALATGTPALVNANMGVAETFRALGLDEWVINFDTPARVCDHIKAALRTRVPEKVRTRLRHHCSAGKIYPLYLDFLKRGS